MVAPAGWFRRLPSLRVAGASGFPRPDIAAGDIEGPARPDTLGPEPGPATGSGRAVNTGPAGSGPGNTVPAGTGPGAVVNRVPVGTGWVPGACRMEAGMGLTPLAHRVPVVAGRRPGRYRFDIAGWMADREVGQAERPRGPQDRPVGPAAGSLRVAAADRLQGIDTGPALRGEESRADRRMVESHSCSWGNTSNCTAR